MKILYLHLYNAGFGMGGAEKVLMDLALAMKKEGLSVACLMNKSSVLEQLSKAGIETAEIPSAKAALFQTVFQLALYCSRFRPDVIHSHHRYTTFLADLLLKGRFPVVHTEHVLRQDKKGFFRPGTVATAVHSSVAENLEKHYGLTKEKILCIPNGVPRPPVNAEALSEMKKKYFVLEEGCIYFLCIGRLEEQKGHIYLIQAAAKLPEAYRKKIKIILAGNGSLETSLKEAASSLGVSGNFVFLGHTPYTGELLELCDVFVLPSLWEGLPLSVLEAFSAQKPVLATDIPGTSDIVRHKETGYLTKARDPDALAAALIDMMNRPDLRDAVAIAGHALWKEHYSLTTMTSRYKSLYTELCKER